MPESASRSAWLDGLPAAIDRARRTIAPHILETPLTRAPWITGAQVWLKCEHLQHTGSFKLRGALNRLLNLTSAEKARGVITASSGNHGQGIALAARAAGVTAKVFVPEDASAVKLAAMAALGVEIETVAGDGLLAELTARRAAEEHGAVFVSPYNDPWVVAGQGTVGAEIADQVEDGAGGLDAVFVAVGGGGLISGVAAALKARNPRIEVLGCWPENAPAMQRCLAAGEIVSVDEQPTISDGTAGGVEPDAITLASCQAFVDRQVLVSEAEIFRAMRLLAEHERWIVEGAAGVALAGLLQTIESFAGKRVAVVLCGRNIGIDSFQAAIAAASAG